MIESLQSIIDSSKSIVFFGGAGVSTESGIPDFRSVDGLYNQKYDYPPEEILSHAFFEKHTEYFYNFYRDKLICKNAEPNSAHLKLAELEYSGKLSAVVTQNIDGLHQKAGSKNVFELHGSVLRNYCTECNKSFAVDYISSASGIPRCDECGSVIKPDVVLYGEGLDDKTVEGALSAIMNADCLIVAGTSLAVYPAAGFISYFKGKHFVLINKAPTPADDAAELVIRDRVGSVLSQIEVK